MVSTNGTVVKESVKDLRQQKRRQARLDAKQSRVRRKDKVLVEFQPDAVEIETRSIPGGARWTLYTVIALICASVAWSCWAEVDQIIVAQGKIITTVPPILIDTKLATPIRTIEVEFGDRVVAGQQLATLDSTFSEADVEQLESQRQQLVALKERLTAVQERREFTTVGHEDNADWLMQYQVFLEKKNEHDAKIREFTAEGSKLKVQQSNNVGEIKFLEETYREYRAYEDIIIDLKKRGSKSEQDVLSRRLQSTDALNNVRKANNRKLELVEELASLKTRKDAYLAGTRAEVVTQLVEASDKLAGVEQELKKAYQSNSYVSVCVPDSLPYKEFVVSDVADNSVGSVIEPGKPLFRLIPVGVKFEAEIDIAGKDIAKIKEGTMEEHESGELPQGSDVRVKLASFSFQKHGTLDGIVRTISESSYEKESPGAVPATMYKARVRLLEPIKLDNVKDDFRLMPGMSMTAEIKVGKRKVIQYFLYPLIRYMDTSIREP